MNVRTIIYEDNAGLRSALAALIGGTEGFELVGAFERCVEVAAHAEALRPDVVLMDIDLPGGMNGIEGAAILKKTLPSAEVLMLTIFDDDERVFEAICAGATGYLLKRTPPSRILEAILEAKNGGAPMSPSIARRVLALFGQKKSSSKNALLEQLTPRELEVLNVLARGLSQKMAAAELGISVGTVHTHVKKVYEKLHVHSISEAISKLR